MFESKTYPSAVDLCRRLEFEPCKDLGQNFLDKAGSITKILSVFTLSPKDRVLEIGPGLGHLSYAILQKGASLTAIELDRRLAPVLERLEQAFPKFRLIWADALAVDWTTLFSPGPHAYLIANLPYYLSSELLHKALLEVWEVRAMALLLQREVAEKFAAVPGSKTYGPLAAFAGLYGRKWTGSKISAGAFYPPPTVESRVLYLSKWQAGDADYLELTLSERQGFWFFLENVFATRRKTLRNNLKAYLEQSFTRADVKKLLDSLNDLVDIDLGQRPEMFSPRQLWYIYKRLTTSPL